MQLEPSALDRHLDADAESLAAGLERVEERRVDMDASVLDRFDAGGDLDELAGPASKAVGDPTVGGSY